MSGYKSGYSESHSPYYKAGMEDGQADAAAVAAKKDPAGPDEAKAGSAMYMRGYRDGLGGGVS